MGAQLKELLGDKVTRVQRTFETVNGDYNLDLFVRHKRITTSLQLELQRAGEAELQKLSEMLDQKREEVKAAKGRGGPLSLASVYEPKNVTCLQLEILVLDLDIVDEKGKPLKPTYENLISLPVEVREAIKEEIDNSVLPKKKTSMTSANGTQPEVNEEPVQVG